MRGKKKSIEGGGYDEKTAIKVFKELDEYFDLLTKLEKGTFNNLLLNNRLKNFFKSLENILRYNLLEISYDNIDARFNKLIDLLRKFNIIKEINKNSDLSKEIVKLFVANITVISQKLQKNLRDIISNVETQINFIKTGHLNQDINSEEIDNIEKYLDYLILLIKLVSNKISYKNTSYVYSLEDLKKSFNFALEDYLRYIKNLSEYIKNYLPENHFLRKKYLQILEKRNFKNENKTQNRKNKFKFEQNPEQKYINLKNKKDSNKYYSTNTSKLENIPNSSINQNSKQNQYSFQSNIHLKT